MEQRREAPAQRLAGDEGCCVQRMISSASFPANRLLACEGEVVMVKGLDLSLQRRCVAAVVDDVVRTGTALLAAELGGEDTVQLI